MAFYDEFRYAGPDDGYALNTPTYSDPSKPRKAGVSSPGKASSTTYYSSASSSSSAPSPPYDYANSTHPQAPAHPHSHPHIASQADNPVFGEPPKKQKKKRGYEPPSDAKRREHLPPPCHICQKQFSHVAFQDGS